MHRPALGELERVGDEVLQDLAQALRVGDDLRRAVGRERYRKSDPFGPADVLELAQEVVVHPSDRDLGHLRGRGARLDLGQVEDAVEQAQQIAARREDDPRVLDLDVGHVVFRVVGQLLGEDEQAVEWCAQLVRHVGDELRLVLRRDGELRRLFLDEALGLFDLFVLLFRLVVAVGEQTGLAFEVFVRFAELLLLRTELFGLRLRLAQQVLGERVGLDGVHDQADALGQLLEERLVRDAER